MNDTVQSQEWEISVWQVLNMNEALNQQDFDEYTKSHAQDKIAKRYL